MNLVQVQYIDPFMVTVMSEECQLILMHHVNVHIIMTRSISHMKQFKLDFVKITINSWKPLFFILKLNF